MSFSMTLVHAPGAIAEASWERLRSTASGAWSHELRVTVPGVEASADGISGDELDAAVRRFVSTADAIGSQRMAVSTVGTPLHHLPAEDPRIHPGMVLLLAPGAAERTGSRAGRRRLSMNQGTGLALCVDTGPDAGRLHPVRRGQCTIGRGRTAVSIADPHISRHHAVLTASARRVALAPAGDLRNFDELTCDDVVSMGTSTLMLVRDKAPASSPERWPAPAQQVSAKPPEGRHRMMLVMACVPLVVGVVLVVVTGMWFFLLFSVASALVAGAMTISAARKRHRFRAAIRQAAQVWGEQTAAALPSPGQVIRALRSPPLSSAEETGRPRGSAVHAEEPAPGETAARLSPAVRIGTGRTSADLTVRHGSGEYDDADAAVATALGIALTPGETTVLHGPERTITRLCRWILVQLVLNPAPVPVLVLGEGTSGAAVTPLLPAGALRDIPQTHMVDADHVEHQLGGSPGVLLAPRGVGGTASARAVEAGWHIITTASPGTGAAAPAGWEVHLEEASIRRRHPAGTRLSGWNLRMDGLSAGTCAEHLRLALPHLTGAAGASEVPASCHQPLPAQCFAGTAEEALVAELGRGSQGRARLDLVNDGPHVIIAGTTGSGKSELLKTLLGSLVARYGPDEVNLVLFDFKGGSAFGRLSELEHTLGMVTDLSAAAADRTLEGIRSELVRREKLFLNASAGDYTQYRQWHPDQPLARVLVVIDEFRIFSHELPEAMDELMRLATLGRSLGLHLVLSTQRPQGVVTADIRANIGAAICLRVRSDDESRDVIGVKDAAHIPRSLPGRAVMRRAGESPLLLQTAQLSPAEQLELVPEATRTGTVPGATPSRTDPAEHIARMLHEQGLVRTHTPLLPSLPESLHPRQRLHDDGAVLLARIDDPAAQDQRDLALDPAAGESLAVVGESSVATGSFCAALAAQILGREGTTHLYVLDGDRSAARHADHPRTAAWLSCEELEEAEYLVTRLVSELNARRMGRSPSAEPVVLLITGYTQWHALTSGGAATGMEHQLGTLLAEGPTVGISVLICGGRELTVGRLSARTPRRIYLPYGVSDDVKHLWPKLRSTDPLSGRGVLITPEVPAPGLTVQLVTEADEPGTLGPQNAPPVAVRTLPERLARQDLSSGAAEGSVVIGVEQFTGGAACYRPGPVNLVLGSPGTGKTSSLQLLQRQLAGTGAETALVTGGEDWDDGVLAGAANPDEVVLVDDAHRCTAQQHQILQQRQATGTGIIATALPSASVFSQLPWAYPARSEGSNLLLSPVARAEADAFAMMVPLLPRPIPGRAVHLRPEGPKVLQLALPQ